MTFDEYNTIYGSSIDSSKTVTNDDMLFAIAFIMNVLFIFITVYFILKLKKDQDENLKTLTNLFFYISIVTLFFSLLSYTAISLFCFIYIILSFFIKYDKNDDTDSINTIKYNIKWYLVIYTFMFWFHALDAIGVPDITYLKVIEGLIYGLQIFIIKRNTLKKENSLGNLLLLGATVIVLMFIEIVAMGDNLRIMA